MARPALMMKRYTEQAHDERLRRIAKLAVEHGITLQMLARSVPPAGVDETAVRRVFEGSKTLDRTVERYARALVKDGIRILSDYECRKLAGTLTRVDMRFLIDREFQEILSNSQYNEKEREEIVRTIDFFDDNHLRKIAELVANFENIDSKTTDLFDGWKSQLAHVTKELDFPLGRLLVASLMTCGVSPRQAVLSIKTMLSSLALRGMLQNADSLLKEFDENQLLAQLSSTAEGLGQDLIVYVREYKRNFERNIKAKLG